jgi:1,4-dihydroxy-2-naphthoate octaprenyltransferase
VRLGATFARWEITLLYTATGAISLYWLGRGWTTAGYVSLGVTMLASGLVVPSIWREAPSPRYNKYLAMAGATLVLFSLAFCGALIWG